MSCNKSMEVVDYCKQDVLVGRTFDTKVKTDHLRNWFNRKTIAGITLETHSESADLRQAAHSHRHIVTFTSNDYLWHTFKRSFALWLYLSLTFPSKKYDKCCRKYSKTASPHKKYTYMQDVGCMYTLELTQL